MRFFDASALVKRYLREAHSASVRSALRRGPVVVSRLSEVEVVAALSRASREGQIPRVRRDRAIAAFVADLAAWHVVEITGDVTSLARVLLVRHALRSGDAIQLASALRFQQLVLEPLKAFVAFDARLLEVAPKEGLPLARQNGA